MKRQRGIVGRCGSVEVRIQLSMLIGLLLVALITGGITLGMTDAAHADFPKPQGFVNDFANVMDRRSEAEIQLMVEALQKEQGVEVAVVTIPTTAPYEPVDYRVQLFKEGGIGGPEDSGLLLLLALEERRVEVEVGYGLEGKLPDGKVGAILDEFVMPHLSRGDYGKGLAEGVKAFKAELSGESFVQNRSDEETSRWISSFLIFLAITIFMRILSRRTPPGGPGSGSGTRRPGGYYGIPRFPSGPMGGRGGRGGFGGGGSGGFGGFGGGRSGGGGAGRKF